MGCYGAVLGREQAMANQLGSLEQIRADLRGRRARFGLSYLICPDHQLSVLAQVIDGL
jgi:hypothetical protein